MACGACHNQITQGKISETDVRLKKSMGIGESMQHQHPRKNSFHQSYFGFHHSQRKFWLPIYAERSSCRKDYWANKPSTLQNNANTRNRLNELVKLLGELSSQRTPELIWRHRYGIHLERLGKAFSLSFRIENKYYQTESRFCCFQEKIDSTMQERLNKGFRKRKKSNENWVQTFICIHSFHAVSKPLPNHVSLLYVYDLVFERKRWWRMVFFAISA